MPKTPAKDKAPKTARAEDFVGCTLRRLPQDEVEAAADIAVQENPLNRPPEWAVRAIVSEDATTLPQRIAALTSKYWGNKGVKLGVYFDTSNSGLKTKLLQFMNMWRTGNPKGSNVTFAESSFGLSNVRVSFDNTGYWSYLGTDVLASFLAGKPTMNLQGFSLSTPDSEYARVVCHETGHTLGFPHEHMHKNIIAKLDWQKTIGYFMQTQGWSQGEVIQQVLTPMQESALLSATPPDPTSIMCYSFPGAVTVDGQKILGGSKINPQDYDYATKIYPPSTPVTPPPPPPAGDRVRIAFDYDEKTNAVSNVVVTAAQANGATP